jgi:hypothetical protein
MLAQEELRELLLASLAARGHRLEDVARFEDGRWQAREPAEGPSALAILRRFDAADYARGAAAFVAALAPEARRAWYRGFTRTAFLVGDPRRVAARLDGLLTHATDDLAWAWSPEDRATLGLRRLLKPLRTSGPAALEPEVRCDLGAGRAMEVVVATGGSTLERYAVDLNHAVCEGLITGALDPGDRLTLRHVAEIESLPPACPYVRVAPDPRDPALLRAAACVREADGG